MAAAEGVEAAGNAGYQSRHMDAIFREGLSFSGFERDLLCLNLGTRKFLDVSGVSGVDSISDGRGSLFADLDNDGDLDIFLTALQGEGHYLFRNNVGSRNGFLRVSLEGTRSGRDAYGAVVRVGTSTGILTKVKAGGSGYLSQSDPRLLFGLGGERRAGWVEVRWPSGARQKIEGVSAGASIRIVEGREGAATIVERRFSLPDALPRDEALAATLAFRRGGTFPDVELRTLGGRQISLRSLLDPGRRYLVNLWATWCVPCGREMPELQRLHPSLRASGVGLLGISLDSDLSAVPGYLRARGITYPIYVAEPSGIEKLYVRGRVVVPLSVLLDGEGRVLEVLSGWSERSREALARLADHGRDRGASR